MAAPRLCCAGLRRLATASRNDVLLVPAARILAVTGRLAGLDGPAAAHHVLAVRAAQTR
jgi:hypothetical protein